MNSANPWKTLGSTLVYVNRWMRVREDKVIRPDGTAGEYGGVELPRSAGVLAFNTRAEVVIVGLWRYMHGRFAWELPTGDTEPGDTSTLDTAKRELLEETGIAGDRWIHLGEVENSNGCTTDVASLYAAFCLDPQQRGDPDRGEISEIRRLPFSEAVGMTLAGEIVEATSVALILKFALLLERRRKPGTVELDPGTRELFENEGIR